MKQRWKILVIAAAILGGASLRAAPAADHKPDRVPAMRMRYLSPEAYQSLFENWKRYAESHPRDGEAWTQLARAAYYANASCAQVREWAQRAVRVAPNDANALSALGRFSWNTYCPGGSRDPAASIRLLEKALAINPLEDDAHYHLWVMRFAEGKRAEADQHLRVLLDNGRMPEPLVDFGYNLLAGLEPDAILVTNGDNDTYPTVALQTARGTRSDVTVVNIGLLNLLWYRRALASGPQAIPVPLLEKEPDTGASEAFKGLVQNLEAEGWKRPLYLAVTVDGSRLELEKQLSLEGIVYRVLDRKGSMEVNEAQLAKNLDLVYRRESCSSPTVDWEQWAALTPLIRNYAAADWQYASSLGRRGERLRARAVMERLLAFCDSRKADDVGREFVSGWGQWDPQAPRLARWKKRFAS